MAGLRLMAIHAHPDDESSKGAATLAKYAAEGNRVKVVTCTDGRRGDILNPAMDRPGAVSYTHLTLPTMSLVCRSRWSPYH